MIKIFDTHAHYDDEDFDIDRETLISSFKDNGVLNVTNIAASLETCKKTLALVDKYDFFYGAIGVHPSEVSDLEEYENTKGDAIGYLKEMASNDRIVSIGEIGLDYHYEDTDKELQAKWFNAQMELARELKLPMIIHSRDAAQDTVDMMRNANAAGIGGVVHCFSYTKETAKIFLDWDFFIGVGGVVTFKNAKKLKEAVEYMPLEKIVLETDCPYLSPDPFRGTRNSSLNIPYVAEEIARLKNISVDEVYEVTFENAKKLYKLN